MVELVPGRYSSGTSHSPKAGRPASPRLGDSRASSPVSGDGRRRRERWIQSLHRLAERLRLRAHAAGESLSDRLRRYAEEGARRDEHPMITFRDGPTGRRAGLIGGPDVTPPGIVIWSVVQRGRERDPDDRAFLRLKPSHRLAPWLLAPVVQQSESSLA